MSNNKGKEVRLDALVSKLHTDGVSRGRAEAEEILQSARKEAEGIREKARKDAQEMLQHAQTKAEEFQQNATASVQLAARDTQRALAHRVRELFDSAFKSRIAEELGEAEFVRELILKLAEDWAGGKPVTAELHPNLGEKLLALAKSGVDGMLTEGIEIRLNRSITNGFRIRRQGEEVAYDFTDDAVAEGLKLHLNAKLTDLLGS